MLASAVLGSDRLVRGSAWRYVTVRSGRLPIVVTMEWLKQSIPVRRKAQDGSMAAKHPSQHQAVFFDVGGLIHAAVGLAGGIGAFLTKRPGFSRNA